MVRKQKSNVRIIRIIVLIGFLLLWGLSIFASGNHRGSRAAGAEGYENSSEIFTFVTMPT
jgi:hypothetical protein